MKSDFTELPSDCHVKQHVGTHNVVRKKNSFLYQHQVLHSTADLNTSICQHKLEFFCL